MLVIEHFQTERTMIPRPTQRAATRKGGDLDPKCGLSWPRLLDPIFMAEWQLKKITFCTWFQPDDRYLSLTCLSKGRGRRKGRMLRRGESGGRSGGESGGRSGGRSGGVDWESAHFWLFCFDCTACQWKQNEGRTMMSSERSFNDHLSLLIHFPLLFTHPLSIAFYSCSLTSHSAT